MEEQSIPMPEESEITIGTPVGFNKNMEYAAKLRKLRKRCKRKYSDHQIAYACGTNDQTAKAWFFGYARPDNQQKQILASLFGVETKELEYV